MKRAEKRQLAREHNKITLTLPSTYKSPVEVKLTCKEKLAIQRQFINEKNKITKE